MVALFSIGFYIFGLVTHVLMFLHKASALLQDHDYVHLISLDFSKAFDMVRHSTLVLKLADLPLPPYIHNWIVEWLNNRQHCTKFQGKLSSRLVINASIIQGSGIGPVAFIIDASDLHACHDGNIFSKYADDMHVLVPPYNSHTIPHELEKIQEWAGNNNLKLNVSKSTEMILYKPGAYVHSFQPPAPLPGIKRVKELKILGVTLTENLSFDVHIDKISSQTALSMYAPRVLRGVHGLKVDSLWDVSHAMQVAKLTYALPGMVGITYLKRRSDDCTGFLSNCKDVASCPLSLIQWPTCVGAADAALFRSILNNENHLLHPLLPPIKSTGYDLRTRAHCRIIPRADARIRRNFIFRMLYQGIF